MRSDLGAEALVKNEGGRSMAKYGRGLNREIVAAFNRGKMNQPFCAASVRGFARENE